LKTSLNFSPRGKFFHPGILGALKSNPIFGFTGPATATDIPATSTLTGQTERIKHTKFSKTDIWEFSVEIFLWERNLIPSEGYDAARIEVPPMSTAIKATIARIITYGNGDEITTPNINYSNDIFT
jgi:hypothetical protein